MAWASSSTVTAKPRFPVIRAVADTQWSVVMPAPATEAIVATLEGFMDSFFTAVSINPAHGFDHPAPEIRRLRLQVRHTQVDSTDGSGRGSRAQETCSERPSAATIR